MNRGRTLARAGELGLLAAVRGESREAALEVVAALVEGGVLGIEITFTTPETERVLEDLRDEYGERILLGAGTIEEPGQVEQAVAGGATFLVSPGCDPDLVSLMLETSLAVIPGILIPTELMLAGRARRCSSCFSAPWAGRHISRRCAAPSPTLSCSRR